MTETQAEYLLLLAGRIEQWCTYGFILALICCGWKLGTHFMRERSAIGGE